MSLLTPPGGWGAAAGWMKVHSPRKLLLSGWWSEQQMVGCEWGSAGSWLSFPRLPFLCRTLVMSPIPATGRRRREYLTTIHAHAYRRCSKLTRGFSNPATEAPCSFGASCAGTIAKVINMFCAASSALVEACYHHWGVYQKADNQKKRPDILQNLP